MFYTITTRPSQSTLVPLRLSTSANLRYYSRKINHHHLRTLTASRHHARGDQPLAPPPPISTVNDDEISHFSRLSALWWDERGEFALLHKMNPHRIRFIREKLLQVLQTQPDATASNSTTLIPPSLDTPRVMEDMDVLDVGCGGGILSEVRSSFQLLILINGRSTTRYLSSSLIIAVIESRTSRRKHRCHRRIGGEHRYCDAPRRSGP
jgi:hypothetical protein